MRDPDFEPEIVPQRRRRPRRPSRARRFTPLRIADFVAATIAVVASLVIVVNATALQGARHPAPLFKPQAAATQPAAKRAAPIAPLLDPAPTAVPAPQPRPVNASRTRAEVVLDVQRELATRGYYDGAVDGSASPRTAEAIREFEQANGLRVAGEANEILLAELRRAKPRSEITGSISKTQEAGRNRVVAVQRTLASYGYGPLRTNGQRDAETRAAIERFEHNRDLPVTGEVTDRLMRDLAVFTGAPLE